MAGAGADDRFATVRRELYSGDPDSFVATRTELSKAARIEGDADLSKQIAALRKPTTSASIVNRHVLADPSVTDRLAEIGDRLRAAQGSRDGIDRDLLRELSTERRGLVRGVSDAALTAFGPTSGASIRDEVVATFDAAVADPEIHARLGELVSAQHWSGFGVVGDAPALTVVRGGKSARQKAADTEKPDAKKTDTKKTDTKKPDTEKQLSAAERELSAAEGNLSAALDEQQAAKNRVGDLVGRLTDLQKQLDVAEQDEKSAREAVRKARDRHRRATSAHRRRLRGR